VIASLRSLRLLEKFETLVCAEDYHKGKPDPEALLIAAARLGVGLQSCLVFEDTDMGIEAATAASMATVKVPPPWERFSRGRSRETLNETKSIHDVLQAPRGQSK
jgi:beta-phosphoglucomutase-like phosphatase (HAD superfamily)